MSHTRSDSSQPKLRERPVVEALLLFTMFVVDRYVLRRWLPPLASALGSAVFVTVAFMPLLIRSKRFNAKRFFLLVLTASLVIYVLSFIVK